MYQPPKKNLAKKILKPIHRSYLRTRQSFFGTAINPVGYLQSGMTSLMLNMFLPQGIGNIDVDARAVELRTNGFVSLPNFYDPALISKIREQFSSALKEESLVQKQRFSDGFKWNKPFEECIPQMFDLLRSKELIKIMQSYYKAPFILKSVAGNRLYPIPEKERTAENLLSAAWHCDDHPTDMVHFVVFLHDVTPDHGPTHLVTRQRTAELMRMGFYTRWDTTLPESVMEDPKHVKLLTGKAGTAHLMAPAVLLHRAGIPSEGFIRDSLFFTLRPGLEPKFTENFGPMKRKAYDFLSWMGEDWRNKRIDQLIGKTIIYANN